jgi:hypothetical protein
LKYVTGYQAYSGDEQNGNFIALHVTVPEGAVVTGELVNGVHGPVTLDEDRVIIFRITNKDTQKIKFVASQYGDSTEYVFDLSGLTLNQS